MNCPVSFRPFGAPARAPASPRADQACPDRARALTTLVAEPNFPCVGAKSALAQGNLAVLAAGSLESAEDDLRIHRRLVAWSRMDRALSSGMRSLAVVFDGPTRLEELRFEGLLWERLGALLALDRHAGHPRAAGFSADPADPDFALSFGGAAYFAVGLHPGASRRARRMAFPTIVFNLHAQFRALRAEGRYERMREVILARDAAYDGSPNPMLARHGEISEARQYSGRAVGEEWVCPLSRRSRT